MQIKPGQFSKICVICKFKLCMYKKYVFLEKVQYIKDDRR